MNVQALSESTLVPETTGELPKLDRILVPTDFSPLSRVAIETAIWFLKRTHEGGQRPSLDLIHVIQPPSLLGAPDVFSPAHFVWEEGSKWAKEQMDVLVSLYQADVNLAAHLIAGNAAQAVADWARHEKFDLIAISSHGRTGLGHVLMGSVAEHIVRLASCPVLLVKPQQDRQGELLSDLDLPVFSRILVGYDHRDGAKKALDMARTVAAKCSASVTLVHALEPVDEGLETGIFREETAEAAAIQEAEERLRIVGDACPHKASDWEYRARLGHPWQVILHFAQVEPFNLIVFGPHKHARWQDKLLGSTVDRVLRQARCPVLVIK